MCTQVHGKFKKLVDTLITDYLSELGVPEEKFSQVSSRSMTEGEWVEFVVICILYHLADHSMRRNPIVLGTTFTWGFTSTK
jgi:hypothetical protein